MCRKIVGSLAIVLSVVLSVVLLVRAVRSAEQLDNMLHTVKTMTRVAKLVTDFREIFRAYHVFIARNDPSSDLYISRALATLMKNLSDRDVFSITTQIARIPDSIKYSPKNLGSTVFVVVIRSMDDFKTLANVTQTSNLKMYRTLVIFTNDVFDCNNPVGNPLHLVFDTKMLVVCQDEPIVREWYSLESNKILTNDLLTWTDNVPGFQRINPLSIHERRNSLKGKSLRVTVVEESEQNLEKLHGFFGTVLLELATLANFKIDLQPVEKYSGSYDATTKQYSGVIGKLHRGMTDIAVGELSISAERLDICDFSKPLLLTRANFYIRKPSDYHLMWSMYYYAFGIRASYCLLSFLLVSPIVVSIVVWRRNKYSFLGNVYENYLNVWGIFCSKSSSDLPEEYSARIAYYSLYVLSFMLSSAYSALLVSYLANLNPALPFYSLREFTAANTHQITTLKNTSYIDTFKVSNDVVMRDLNDFLLDDEDLPSTLISAVNQACDKDNNIVLYMDDALLYNNQLLLPCELIAFERNRLGSMAIAFSKHSQYMGLINYHLQRLRAAGLLDAIKHQHFKKLRAIPVDYNPVDLYSTMPAFSILLFGMILSVTLIIMEKIFYHCFEQRDDTDLYSIRRVQFGRLRRTYSRINRFIAK